MASNSTEAATMGALSPPSRVTPNFIDPPSQRYLSDVTLSVCLVVATSLVSLRVYTKWTIIKSFHNEDYVSILAWLGLIGYSVIWFEACGHGSGVHQWNVTIPNSTKFLELANLHQVYYAPLIFVTKLSILLQYLRIFVPTHQGSTYWLVHIMIWINLMFAIAILVLNVLICIPRAKIWNPSVSGHCVNMNGSIIATASFNSLMDFFMFMLPLYCISQLQMTITRKIGVSAVFATGFFACLSSIIRIVFSVRLSTKADVTFYLQPVALWTFAEVTSGVVCGCLPIVPPFFHHFLPKLKSKFSSDRGSKAKNHGSKFGSAPGLNSTRSKFRSKDPYMLTGDYVELNERDHMQDRPSMSARSGLQPYPEATACADDVIESVGGECEGLGSNTIRKTVRIETSG